MKKGILKKISTGLKIAATYIPLAVAVAVPAMAMGGLISSVVMEDKIYTDIRNSENFAIVRDADLEEYNQQYQAGEISSSEFNKKLNELTSNSYAKEVVNLDMEGNAELQARIKQNNVLFNLGMGSFVAMLGTTSLAAWYMIGGTRKKLEQKIKGTYKEEPEKINDFEDEAEEVEELGSIDDYFENYKE